MLFLHLSLNQSSLHFIFNLKTIKNYREEDVSIKKKLIFLFYSMLNLLKDVNFKFSYFWYIWMNFQIPQKLLKFVFHSISGNTEC